MEESKNDKDQKFENELKKAKLIAENGAKFMETSNLPPEVEAEWLNHIAAFEDAYQNSKMIKIKALLGNPELRLPSELPEEEIMLELNKVTALLEKHNINLSTICAVEPKEIYRFIVEELLEEETEEKSLPGWTNNYIYEEFHPNHDYDIKHNIESFLNNLFRKAKEYCDMELASTIISHDGTKIKSSKAKKMLINFMDSTKSMHLLEFEFKENKILEFEAFQGAYMKYKMILKETNESMIYEGNANFNLIKKYDYWCINSVDMPGFRF